MKDINAGFNLNLDLNNENDRLLLLQIAQVIARVPAPQTSAVFKDYGSTAETVAEAVNKAVETEAAVNEDKPKRGRGRPPKVDGPVAEAEPVNPPPVQAAPEPVTIEGEAEPGDETMAQENARDEAPPVPAVDPVDAMRAAMKEHIDTFGVPPTVAILRKFGAAKQSEVKPEDVVKVTAAFREALAANGADPLA